MKRKTANGGEGKSPLRRMALAGAVSMLLTGIAAAKAASVEIRDAGIITQTKSTSSCIGDPITPVCALETWIACLTRLKPGLCAAVGLIGLRFRQAAVSSKGFYLYRPLAIRSISQLIVKNLNTKYPWAAVENKEIEYAGQACTVGESVCFDQPAGRHSLFVRPVRNGWYVAGWVHEVGDVYCEHFLSGDKYDRECELMIPDKDHTDYYRLIRRADPDPTGRGLWIDPTPHLKRYAPN